MYYVYFFLGFGEIIKNAKSQITQKKCIESLLHILEQHNNKYLKYSDAKKKLDLPKYAKLRPLIFLGKNSNYFTSYLWIYDPQDKVLSLLNSYIDKRSGEGEVWKNNVPFIILYIGIKNNLKHFLSFSCLAKFSPFWPYDHWPYSPENFINFWEIADHISWIKMILFWWPGGTCERR